jgi:hypothetical protein
LFTRQGKDMNKELEALGGVNAPKLSDFWAWVGRTFTPSYQNEIEGYLSDSVDHKDLETRTRTLVRRGML